MKQTAIAPSHARNVTRPASGRASALIGRTFFLLCLSSFVLISLAVSVPATHALDQVDYVLCANENQVCSFHGTKNVGYGAKGKMVYKNATNGIPCTNEAFGTDPIHGVPKQCYVGPEGLTFCAAEGGVCSFSGTRTVVYGTSNRFVRRVATNGISCNNAAFGSDPRVGVKKSCYVSRH